MGKRLLLFLFTLASFFAASDIGYGQAPVVTSFSPAKGFVGTQVTITGSNFNNAAANNIVYFGATRANVVSAGTNSLVVQVPVGATFQPISVLNTASNLSGYSRYPFHTTFPSKGTISKLDFDQRVDFATDRKPSSVAFGDLDGDGRSDMVVTNQDASTISIFRSTATPDIINASSFVSRFEIPTGTSPSSVEIGDVDGDGKLDILLANYLSNSVAIFRNQSSGPGLSPASFAPRVDITTADYPYVIKLSDMDGDGKPDLAVSYSFVGSALSIFHNQSTPGNITAASFGPQIDMVTGNGYYSVALADVTNNGKPEILLTDASRRLVSVFRNKAVPGTLNTGSFDTQFSILAAPNPLVINAGDMDGDGKTDLVLSNFGTSLGPTVSDGFYLTVILNRITSETIDASSFGQASNFETGRIPQSSIIGDLDGDGKLDAVTTNYQDAELSIFHNTSTIGTAMFDPRLNLTTGTNPQSVKIADVDGDGKPDIINVNFESNTVSIYRNNASSLQSIAFPPLGSVVYGTPDFPTGASSNNPTNPINYTSSNPGVAIVTAGGLIHTVGVGTTVIMASQNATPTAAEAIPVSQTLTVTPAPLSIKANDIIKQYSLPLPTLTATYTTLVNGDTPASIGANITISTTADATSVPGTYPITLSGTITSPNYTATYANGVLTIAKLQQTLFFDPIPEKDIDDPDFDLEAVASSGLPVTYTSSNPIIADVAGSTVQILKVGKVDITATQAGDDVYEAVSATRQLSITSGKIVIVSNTITPNGDGINDTWLIYGLDFDETATVSIFNRNGGQVFQSKGYPVPFNGMYNGKKLTGGVYYYVINFTNGRKPRGGNLTILY